MDPLGHLNSLLSRIQDSAARDLKPCQEMDQVLRQLEGNAKGAGSQKVPLDLQREAVLRFWKSLRLDSLREGRLVCFGLCLASAPGGPCILEDRRRFSALLSGVNQWLEEPRRYRRCYQGLVTNYFGYDSSRSQGRPAGKENWATLGRYLTDHSTRLSDGDTNPDWVSCVATNPRLFGDAPCEQYAADMLRGETQGVLWLRNCLGIEDSSWFVRELLLAQVAAATKEGDSAFMGLLPRILALLAPNVVVRDRGLILLLNRYANVASRPLQQELRDCAVEWWGNPWLTSNSMRWGGVDSSAREMVAEWLKLEFIEAFFTLLAEEGRSDRRRLEFWKRYVNAIDHINFALGSDARNSRTKDFADLRAKMKGLIVPLMDPISSNNAFVMTIGDLVVVEFSGRANALYGYDRRRGLPFDLEKPVVTVKDHGNSLKNSGRSLWLKHADNGRGWVKWEDRFESHLFTEFRIEPTGRKALLPSPTPAPRTPSRRGGYESGANRGQPPGTIVRYSPSNLRSFVAQHGLSVEDNTERGGSLWVRTTVWDMNVDRVLSAWGFKFRLGRGWWR